MKHILFLIFVFSLNAFPEFNDEKSVFAHYQQQSFTPMLHVYFNNHFKNSKQFSSFEVILNELQEDIRDYASIIFTDCDKNTDEKLETCNIMERTKDNRDIVGTVPSADLKTFGHLAIQSPPETRSMRHSSDVYNKEELLNFVDGLLPNFYKELHNKEEYEGFLLPRYVPKIILFNREDEDEVSLTMKKISVHFHLRFDFGLIYDLTEDLIPSVFDIKGYPKLMVITYNFDEKKHDFITFKGDLDESSYYRVKRFLQPFALKQPRNDYIFHKVAMQQKSEIQNAQTEGELTMLLEKVNGWSFIHKTATPNSEKLQQLQQKYGRYFEYIHVHNEGENGLSMYNPSQKQDYLVEGGQLKFFTMSANDFYTNMTVWLAKDFVVMGVREEFSYICSITEKYLFRDHVRCFIIREEEYEQFSKMVNTFDVGFVSETLYDEKEGKDVTKGSPISSTVYEEIYYSLEYATRVKLRDVLNRFMDNPITEVKHNGKLAQHCYHPTKKCFLLFTDLSKKDRTLQAYVKEVAMNYIEAYIFYEVDINSNTDLMEEMGVKGKANLVVFYPRTSEYVRLDKKVTKGLIAKFMKANLSNDKRLKRHKLGIEDIRINRLKVFNSEQL